MCLAIPVRVEQLCEDNNALVDIGGVKKQVSVALVEDVQVGDYVIMHVGFALNKVDPDEAEKTLALFAEMGVLEQALADNAEALAETEASSDSSSEVQA
ncbi:HypC/HybG/HupF family hydrogenase formation chaperone [Motiliproteus coralliicola]|uniref:HypC/HybG/HupF family hydrogenase formation chaperone n=1 Tax=Motiliproteus coralliicola TaxID=2283196 RepID=A0A369WF70_9GAMM|nr:HypC/HybG/HupF family hydrogenase formation chaperone [Motiliproteus coralliicola]RDE19809.1 HypC/HybG/HupF family hydrogenase formation chaperone [Motiliproteus coralliicola]